MGLLQEAESLTAQLERDYKYLHQHAEVGFDLTETAAYVELRLTEMGYQPRRCGRSGIVAAIGDGRRGKCILLRADMDALPIREQSGVEFACQNGNMHACGHDMHTAMLLGAAQLLKAHESELGGSVKLMFQPAEEILEGAHDMIKDGVLSDPVPDAAVMIHVISGTDLPAGTVIIPPAGVSAPAADYFSITIKGVGCHGSSPAAGIDPLNCAAHIHIALQEIPARELAVTDRAVLTIGSLNGGNAANVIPDEVIMRGTLRAYDENVRKRIKERILEISGSIAIAFRAEANLTFDSGCPSLNNDAKLCDFAAHHLKALLGNDGCLTAAQLNSSGTISLGGSEDFAYVSHKVPALMLALTAGQPKHGYMYNLHHPQVKFDMSALPAGCAVYAHMAASFLESDC